MTTIDQPMPAAGIGILDRERIIATTGFNRWLVPPAALCIHLCIGMAYGFSVFWLPLSRAIGLTAPKACPDMSLMQELFTTTCDWRVASMGWMFTLFFVVLGVAAAVWGGWLERAGPRKAGFVAAQETNREGQRPERTVYALTDAGRARQREVGMHHGLSVARTVSARLSVEELRQLEAICLKLARPVAGAAGERSEDGRA